MAELKRKACFPKKYSQPGRHPETGAKIVVFVLSCPGCKIYNKTFLSRSKRDQEYEQHK